MTEPTSKSEMKRRAVQDETMSKERDEAIDLAKSCVNRVDRMYVSDQAWFSVAKILLAEVAAREAAEAEAQKWVAMEKRIPLRLTVETEVFGGMHAFDFYEHLRQQGQSMDEASGAVLGTMRRVDGSTLEEIRLRDQLLAAQTEIERLRKIAIATDRQVMNKGVSK